MTVQTTYLQTPNVAFPGSVPGMMPGRTVTALNPSSREIDTVTIDTVANATTYTISVQGIVSSYLSDGSATEAEIRAGLIAAVNINLALSGIVVASAGVASSDVVLTASSLDNALLTTVSADLSVVITVAAGASRRFGLFYGYGAAPTSSLGGKTLVPMASGVVLMGALRHTHASRTGPYPIPYTHDSGPGRDQSGLLAGEDGNIVLQGEIWMHAETSFTIGQAVNTRITAAAGLPTVGIATATAPGAAIVAVPGARAEEYRAELGLVRVTLNIPA